MLQLWNDSANVIRNDFDEIETLYSWMDVGSTLTHKMRNNKKLDENDIVLVSKLNTLISSVALKEEIVLYRGVTTQSGDAVEAHQFNAMSPLKDATSEYGDVMVVHIPVGTNCFYVSVWEEFVKDVESSEEKEILFPPGKFTCLNPNKEFIFHQY